MRLVKDLVERLPDGDVLDVCIGMHWTAVVVKVGGEKRCGLAATLGSGHSHHQGEPDVPKAGKLTGLPAVELAHLALLDESTQTSVGLATINALLPVEKEKFFEANAEEVIANQGAGKKVVLVGHFPFTKRLAMRVGSLAVLEKNPGLTDYPADRAPDFIPNADVVAITGMTIPNYTLEGILALCRPDAFVIILGPSTPLSPLLFDYGIDIISGAQVEEIDPVMRVVAEGGNFRQVHRAGVRLVNLQKMGG